ncbi:hypothetical protein ABT297_39675 [Dactylosporangium sp. NPDC000555]|uniref:hypothetical protein n=1 Tax=Dactylosporangium sp. NPDC000555 TaxID=3154260 RepID=UPI003328632E
MDALIDDLIHDILSDAGRATGITGRGRAGAGGLLESVMGLTPRLAPGTPLLERVLLVEALAGALSEALAPALASALAPRILQLMEGEGSEGSEGQARPPAAGTARPPSRKTDATK